MGAETAIIGGALGLGSALIGAEGASDAASTQAAAANQAAQLQWQMYQQQRQDMAPWTQAGAGAVNALWGTPGTPATTTQGAPIYGQGTPGTGALGGLPNPYVMTPEGPVLAGLPWSGVTPGTTFYDNTMANMGNQGQIIGYQPGTTTPATPGTQGLIQRGPGEFKESPSYQFAVGEGQKGIQRAASATGRLASGDYLKDSIKYAEGMASQEYQNFLNRYYKSLEPYFQMARLGQGSTNTLTNATGNYAQNAGNYLTYAGNANAAGQLGQANTIANAGNWAGNQYLNNNYMNQLQNQNALNSYWKNAQYTPQQMNSMGWL